MGGCLGTTVIEVLKCLKEPIICQFNYLCCFSTNIQNLADEAKRLDVTKEELDGRIADASRNNQEITPRAKRWLDDVDEIKAKMTAIEREKWLPGNLVAFFTK
ncbi:hypothetical protein ACS0TY_025136 [Phlomoides rotata]